MAKRQTITACTERGTIRMGEGVFWSSSRMGLGTDVLSRSSLIQSPSAEGPLEGSPGIASQGVSLWFESLTSLV